MPLEVMLVPHVREVKALLDAEELFRRGCHHPGTVFLDGGNTGPFSFLAVAPLSEFSWFPGDDLDPFEAVRQHLARHRLVEPLPVPFGGGVVGWFGYDCRTLLERLPDRHGGLVGLPGVHVRAYRVVAALDHRSGRTWVIHLAESGEAATNERVGARASELLRLLETPRSTTVGARAMGGPLRWPPRDAYLFAVERAKELIRAGEIYQVNLAQRFRAPAPRDLLALYGHLRQENPPTFGAFISGDDWAVLSLSPERFLRVRNRRVETRPIKGTAGRAADPREDALLAEHLRASPKDRAELAMIVDILRNDLSRVCVPGSVVVENAMTLETHPTVHHLVADVTGSMEDGYDLVDLLAATLPGGSITGAPRIRAMEIIDELEPFRRGAYTGSLGYLGYDGSMDLNILIRTVTAAEGLLHIDGGGGIVADSEPELEYQETLHKLRGILRVFEGVASEGLFHDV